MTDEHRRRPADTTVHEWQHRLNDERVAAFRTASKRSGLDKHLRRELEKKAFWSVKGHLESQHRLRRFSPFATLENIIVIHDELHLP